MTAINPAPEGLGGGEAPTVYPLRFGYGHGRRYARPSRDDEGFGGMPAGYFSETETAWCFERKGVVRGLSPYYCDGSGACSNPRERE